MVFDVGCGTEVENLLTNTYLSPVIAALCLVNPLNHSARIPLMLYYADLQSETRTWYHGPISPADPICIDSNYPLRDRMTGAQSLSGSFGSGMHQSGYTSYWRAPKALGRHDKFSSGDRRREGRNAGCAMKYTRSEHVWKSNGAGATVLRLRSLSACTITSGSQERYGGSCVREEYEGSHGSLTKVRLYNIP